MYRLNLEKKILDNIIYEVDSSDIVPDNYYTQPYCSSCELVELKGYLIHSAACFLVLNQLNYPDNGCNLLQEEDGKRRYRRSSETSVDTRSTRRHIAEDVIFHSHRRENLKSYK
jgi:hypothetical protein